MNLDLEILKKLYTEEVKKLDNLPFYQYLQKERERDIKRDILMPIKKSTPEDIFKEIEAYLNGQLLEGIAEKIGGRIGGDLIELADKTRRDERDSKYFKLVGEKREKIKDKEYHHALDYLFCVLTIKKIVGKLLDYNIVPEVNMEGKIVFKAKEK